MHTAYVDGCSYNCKAYCKAPSRCITWRVLDTSCPPTQTFGGSSNLPLSMPLVARIPASSHVPLSAQFAADDLLTLQTADSVTTNHGSSHIRPINTSHFHHGPKHILRAPHAPHYQAHAASKRRCSHICLCYVP